MAPGQFGGGQIPQAAPDPYATLGYNPNAALQNGFGYPGGNPSQLFNQAQYQPSQTAFNSYQQPGVGSGGYGDPFAIAIRAAS